MDYYAYQRLLHDQEHMARFQPLRDHCRRYEPQLTGRYSRNQREYAADLRSTFLDYVCHYLAGWQEAYSPDDFAQRFAALEAGFLRYVPMMPVRFWFDRLANGGDWTLEPDKDHIQKQLEEIKAAAKELHQ